MTLESLNEDNCRNCGVILPVFNWEQSEAGNFIIQSCDKCGTEHVQITGENHMCEEILIKETTKGIELTDVNGATIVISNHTEAVKLARDLLDISIEVIG